MTFKEDRRGSFSSAPFPGLSRQVYVPFGVYQLWLLGDRKTAEEAHLLFVRFFASFVLYGAQRDVVTVPLPRLYAVNECNYVLCYWQFAA